MANGGTRLAEVTDSSDSNVEEEEEEEGEEGDNEAAGGDNDE